MVLPILKLGTLAIRTACKPIAKRIKKEAGLHPEFRLFIINIAQANHRFTTQMQRIIYNHSTDVAIRPLNEEKAVKAAADLLGEMFVFTVAGTAVIFEVQRSAKSEAKKEEMRKQEITVIQQQNESLAEEVELLRKRVEELEKQAKERGFIVTSNKAVSTAHRHHLHSGRRPHHCADSRFDSILFLFCPSTTTA